MLKPLAVLALSSLLSPVQVQISHLTRHYEAFVKAKTIAAHSNPSQVRNLF